MELLLRCSELKVLAFVGLPDLPVAGGDVPRGGAAAVAGGDPERQRLPR